MQLMPYFQPIVDIATAKVVGHEVLARTLKDDGSVISAGHIFTDNTLDEQIVLGFDRAVRSQALQRFAQAGQPGFLTINISPRWIEILDDPLIPTIEMLGEYNVSPEKILVEIVETNSCPEKLLAIVKRYRAMGMRIAVDDFGAGCSQFDRVIQLEPDIVKLDMRLFKQAMSGGFPQHIVQSLSFLAERMGSQVLCEGVETYAELRFALDIGSKLIQGFMFSAARNDFSASDDYARQIAINRKQFLLEGIHKEDKFVENSRIIHSNVDNLCDQIRSFGMLVDLSIISSDLILSLFICEVDGTQISPTYRLNAKNEWEFSREQIGNNWCWRPYFYQLISGAETMQRLSVTSRSYHDASTGALIKTIARFIDKNTILMVDIKEQRIFEY